MTRWIPLTTFKSLYTKETDLLSADTHAQFLRRLESDEGEVIRKKEGIDILDFRQFLTLVKSPEHIVFYGWIGRSNVLQKTLENQKVSGKFRDEQGALNHTLSSKFQTFVSPFLGSILVKRIPDEIELLTEYFSYVPLLEADTRAMVESQLFQPVRAQLKNLKTTDTLSSEQALIDAVKPLCEAPFIESMNYLSKRSYAQKMEYVDSIMEAIRSHACTVRFANWILKQMERLDLNKEHEEKLYDLRKELAAGKLQVRQLEAANRTSIRLRPILLGIVLLGIIGAGIYVLLFKPFSETEVYHAYDSAKAEFTDEELAKIDSLALEIDKESFMEGRMIDPDIIIQTGTSITLRNPYKTSLMERIFTDVNKDVTLKENYPANECKNVIGFQRYPGVKDLTSRTANKRIQFRNDSQYDLIVYVTNNKTSGAVYSMLVLSGSMAEFEMNVHDVLTTVAGNDFVAFVPPLGSFAEEKPSQYFRHHFCDTDNNYFESINTALELQSTSRDVIKFMVQGAASSDYQLIDVYNVATAY